MQTQTLKKKLNNFLFWNCASGVFSKKSSIEKYIAFYEPCIIFVSECDVSPDHMHDLLKIPGYRLDISKTRESRGKGRVMAYVRSGMGFSRRNDLEHQFNDILVYSSKDITIVGVYCGFKTYENESVISNLERLLTNLRLICDRNHNVMIGGDFNVDPSRQDKKSKLVELWQTDCGLEQLVTDITRTRDVNGLLQQSMIDLIFTKDLDNVTVSTVESEVSDHSLMIAKTEIKTDVKIKFQKQIIVDWRNFDHTKMSQDLKCNLEGVALGNAIDRFDRDLSIAILTSMNEMIPKRVIHLRRDTDVVNYHIEAVKKKRDRLIKKARKTNSSSIMATVKELNKVIKLVVKRERDRIIKNKMKNSSAKTFWSTVNGLLGRGKNDEEITLLGEDDLPLSEEDVAQAFSDFFLNKVENLIKVNPIPDIPQCIKFPGIIPFSREEIRQALESFKPKKSSGPDEIPLIVLKLCYNALEDHIKHLFDLISESGKIPQNWKMARLKPIFKKGDETKVQNYRPISNLNSISKLFERCLLNRVSTFDTDGPNQHGFKPGHSTTTAAVELQEYIADALDRNKQCLVYSTDLSAAFDLIRPGLFVEKARQVIPDEGLISLMYEFITDRKAYVEIGHSTSTTFSFPAGCPQGSTLGPKVFNIYCNDLYEHITDGKLISYADDSYVVVVANDRNELLNKTRTVMTNHLKWLKDNGMVCNVDKTEMMILDDNSPVTIEVDGRTLTSLSEMKVLGLTFDSQLTWSSQVKGVIKRTNRMLHGLRRIRRFLNTEQARQVVTAYYFSVLYYGLEVWFHRHLAFHLKQKIRSAHYRALRLVHGDKSREQLDQEGKRATPDELANFAVAKLISRMVHLQAPTRLLASSLMNSYSVRRQPGRLFFYDASARKIGRQCLKNRLGCISKQMKFNWTMAKNSDVIRVNLKRCFFSYV